MVLMLPRRRVAPIGAIPRIQARWKSRIKTCYLLTAANGYRDLVKGTAAQFYGTNQTLPDRVRTGGTIFDYVLLPLNEGEPVNSFTLLAVSRWISGSVSWSLLSQGFDTWYGVFGAGDASSDSLIGTHNNSFDGNFTDSPRNGRTALAAHYAGNNSMFGAVNGRYFEDTACTMPLSYGSSVFLGGAKRLNGTPDNMAVADHWLYATFYPALTAREEMGITADPMLALFEPQRRMVPVAAASSRTLPTSLSAAIQSVRSVSSELSLAVQTQRSASAQVESAVQRAASASSSLDAAVQAARSATASVSAAVQASGTRTASIDAALQTARSATSSLDAAVQAARSATASASAYVQAGSTAAASVSAAVQSSPNVSLTLSLATQVAREASASLSAAVQALRTETASISAQVQAGTTVTASLSAAVEHAVSAAAAVSAGVQRVRFASAELSASVQVSRMAAAAVTAAVQRASSAGASLSAYVYVEGVGIYPDAATVLAGIEYGPTGADYTGSLELSSAAEIAVAVLAAMNATPPKVDVDKMNGAEVTGTGTDGDPWRGVGVPP